MDVPTTQPSATPQLAMHGETVFAPTASGHAAPLIGVDLREDQPSDKNQNILGKYAPIAGMSVFGFLMLMFYISWKEQSALTNSQIRAAQDQVTRFYEQTKEQHTLDRLANTEQRIEDRKVRREELVEQRLVNEQMFKFTRDLQIILVEDSAAIKALKEDNKNAINAVRTNQQVIIDLQRSLNGKPLKDKETP